jgi:hypothetical protein
MSQLPVPGKRYGEKEVSRLLKRAAELQRLSPTSPNPMGLTLAELEEIAEEAGLDVALLRQAARELETTSSPGTGAGPLLAGGPTKFVLERTLPFEASNTAFEALVPIIQSAATSAGSASQIGRTFTWQTQAPNSSISLQVTVSIRRGETLIRVDENHATLAGALFAGGLSGGLGIAIGGGGALGAALGSVVVGVGAPIAFMGLSYYVMRSIFARKSRTRSRILAELLERIVAELSHQPE